MYLVTTPVDVLWVRFVVRAALRSVSSKHLLGNISACALEQPLPMVTLYCFSDLNIRTPRGVRLSEDALHIYIYMYMISLLWLVQFIIILLVEGNTDYVIQYNNNVRLAREAHLRFLSSWLTIRIILCSLRNFSHSPALLAELQWIASSPIVCCHVIPHSHCWELATSLVPILQGWI